MPLIKKSHNALNRIKLAKQVRTLRDITYVRPLDSLTHKMVPNYVYHPTWVIIGMLLNIAPRIASSLYKEYFQENLDILQDKAERGEITPIRRGHYHMVPVKDLNLDPSILFRDIL